MTYPSGLQSIIYTSMKIRKGRNRCGDRADRQLVGHVFVSGSRLLYGAERRRRDEALRLYQEAYWEDDPQRQAEMLSEAAVLTPKDGDIYITRGMAYAAMGEDEKALSDYEMGVRLCPKKPEAYNNRGFWHYQHGDFERAIVDFDRALRLRPLFSRALLNRGAAYGMMGERARALADFDKAIELGVMEALGYLNRGIYYLNLGERERGEEDLRHVIELDEDDSYTAMARQYLAREA